MSESDNDKAWREAAMTMPTYEHEITAYLGCSLQEVEKAKVRCIWDVGDWMQTEDACREIAKLRKALVFIRDALGPTVPDHGCVGCQVEMQAALDAANEALEGTGDGGAR